MPDYPSTHTVVGAAAAEVLIALFGDAVGFDTTSLTLPGVTRQYTGLLGGRARERAVARLRRHPLPARREGRPQSGPKHRPRRQRRARRAELTPTSGDTGVTRLGYSGRMLRSPVVLALLLAFASASCQSSAPHPPVTGPAAPAAAAAGAATEQASATPGCTQFARGYFPGRSGQVFLVPREGEFIVDRNPLYAFMHGSPWAYDTHIPLLLYGPPFIKTLVWNEPVSQQDVVPTLAALLGTAPPATAIGRPLREALAPATTRPRVVALLVLDGTRADYFDTYRDVLPTLSRLRAGGAWFSQAHVSSVPTLTAVGHANLGTGAEPRTHGLAVNNLFNRVTGKSQEAYDAARSRRDDGADAGRRVEHRDRGQGRHHRPGRRHPRHRRPRRPRRLPRQRAAGPRRQLQHGGRRQAGRPTRSATRCPTR